MHVDVESSTRGLPQTMPRGLFSSLAGRCLRFLLEHPGASGTQVRDGLEIRHLSQVSRLLSRLKRAGLVDNRRVGRANCWVLTQQGETLLAELEERWGANA